MRPPAYVYRTLVLVRIHGECAVPPASQDTMTGLGRSLLLKHNRGYWTLGLYVLAFGPIVWGEPLGYLLVAGGPLLFRGSHLDRMARSWNTCTASWAVRTVDYSHFSR